MFGQKANTVDPIEVNQARLHETLTSSPSLRDHYHVIHERDHQGNRSISGCEFKCLRS